MQLRRKEQSERSYRWKAKDLSTIWRELEANCKKDIVRVAREIYDWVAPLAAEIFCTKNGFGPNIVAVGNNHHPVKVTNEGDSAILFHNTGQRNHLSISYQK